MADCPSDPAGAPLVVRLFGGVEVLVHGRAWHLLEPRQRVGWLLGLLILRSGAPSARREVEFLFWPARPGEGAEQQQLRNLLRLLRRGLGEESWRVSSPTRATLALDLAGAEVDVVAFDEAIRRGDLPSLQRAVALHRGSLLEGCQDEWAEIERNRREQQFLSALETLAVHALSRGDETSALRYVRQAVAADPYEDRFQRHWMEVLMAQGDLTAAMGVYDEHRRRCRGELREPEPETTALFDRIRLQARTPVRSPRTGSAIRTGDADGRYEARFPGEMVGREEEVAALRERVFDHGLVTLRGVGGVGKSRLADRVAQELVAENAAWTGAFVELAAVSDGERIAEAVARHLKLDMPPDRPAPEALASFLRPNPFLLVLDNCEHVRADGAKLAEVLLRKCPHLRLLATSREPLGLPEEELYSLAPLPTPPEGQGSRSEGQWPTLSPADPRSLTLDPRPSTLTPPLAAGYAEWAQTFPSVRLFLLRAGLGDGAGDDGILCAVGEICRRLDGLPLAIELAASRVRLGSLTVLELAAGLRERWDLLAEGSPAGPFRHRTLEAAIAWSWDLLSEEERRLLRQLAVFVGGWTLEAAAAVVSSAAVPILLNLVDKSLVVTEERAGRTRYRLLETIRQFAAAKLQAAGEELEARRRHASAFLEMAERAEPELDGPDQKAWLDRLEADHGNLCAALDEVLARGDVQLGLALAAALQRFWHIRSHTAEARRYLRTLLDRSEGQCATLARAGALHALAVVEEVYGNQPESYRLAQEQLALCRDLVDRRAVGRALGHAAHAALNLVKLDEAERLLQEGLAISRELGDLPGVAFALRVQGHLAEVRGDFFTASKHYDECLAVRRRLGHRREVAICLLLLGGVVSYQGEYVQARTFFEEAAAMQRELGDRNGLVSSLSNLATLALEQGELARTWALLEECSSLTGRRSEPSLGYLTLLGEISLRGGDLDEARSLFEHDAALCREHGHFGGLSRPLLGLARHAFYRGSHDEAISLCEESLACYASVDDPRFFAQCQIVMGRSQIGLGDLERARNCLREGMRLFRQMECSTGVSCEALDAYADVALHTGEAGFAARLLAASSTQRDRQGVSIYPVEQANHDARLKAARAALGEEAFVAAWEQGRTLPVRDAIALALGEAEAASTCREEP